MSLVLFTYGVWKYTREAATCPHVWSALKRSPLEPQGTQPHPALPRLQANSSPLPAPVDNLPTRWKNTLRPGRRRGRGWPCWSQWVLKCWCILLGTKAESRTQQVRRPVRHHGLCPRIKSKPSSCFSPISCPSSVLHGVFWRQSI